MSSRTSAAGEVPGAVERARRLLDDFLRLESAGGLVLMAAAAAALVVANSPLASVYGRALDLELSVRAGSFGISKPLLLWINDGVMAVFFLLVGLELKREVVEGHLSSLRKASLAAIAAAGGMLVPAAIYAALNRADAAALRGWAIPTATDIAFALGILSLAKGVPTALKAFLLSVAIFDDLGAIVVIAVFYTESLSVPALAVAAAMVAVLFVLNRANVTRPAAYILAGVPLWVAVLKSGVHATLAGVIVATFIPIRPPGRPNEESPLRRLEHVLHPWVAFGVLPLFALANAGVPILGLSLRDVLRPAPLGIALGLLVGKQLGIFGACVLGVRARIAALPEGIRWRQLHAVSLLCGVGFTMSLFIASLAADAGDATQADLSRLGIVIGSLLAGILGFVALRRATRTGLAGE